ncbi:hypothetical protein DNTS_026014 [Danionella cerebrum]|uniref:Amyloid-beta A4 precursor protein-binding family A member 3 n=1 Tax=Danionella cerebrum TaxID=2873325 RepID=A0A553PVK8_9TELE|nr:hypothetical protein DNTS_026014 [Danionella translucida]
MASRRPPSRSIVSGLNSSTSSSESSGKVSREELSPVESGDIQHDELDFKTSLSTAAGISPSGSSDDSSRAGSPPHPDSMEEDSLSEYDNVGSENEHDNEEDEELQTEADRMTYYVHCCPEDESYMEGLDCHEGTDGVECPGTSRIIPERPKQEETWKNSQSSYYKVAQQDTATIVYRQAEPITETAFVQAPMAEDEEDVDETDEEEDSEEEDCEELNNNEIQHDCDCSDVFLRDERSRPKDCSHVKVAQKTQHVPQASACAPRYRKERVREGISSNFPKDGGAVLTREGKDPNHLFKSRGRHLEESVRTKVHQGASSRALVKKGTWKTTHSLKHSTGKDENNAHCQRKSPNGDTRKGGDFHKPKTGNEKKICGFVEEEKIDNEVENKLVIAPNNSGRSKVVSAEKASVESSHSTSFNNRETQSNAFPNRSVPLPDKQVQESPRKSVESEKTRPSEERTQKNLPFPSFVDTPGPCEPEDLINGIIFAANFLGSTQLLSVRNPTKSMRMKQAQEAVDSVKSLDGEGQNSTEIDLFISTKAIKVLNADTQETLMDNALRTISYIADIGSLVVLMARRHPPNDSDTDSCKQYRMICYVFESEDAQLIAQSIGQAFSMAYQEFLRANGINPRELSQKEYSSILNSQEMYNHDLVHFSNSDNCKELQLEKQKGEMLGVVIVESGWGSILPTVILACLLNHGPAARSGKLSVGDQIMAVNHTSLVGLPLATCQAIIKGLKNDEQVKLSVVSCPPVTTVLIKRPDLQYQLGFSVQNGIICSLMRGGIAERGGVRVGHRIIEINGQSVVAMAHEKIVHALSVSVGEINMKTMPAVMFRLLTGQETPVYI